jgi:DNA modification methylase
VTSPPYWEQREYLPAEHPDKPLEIGHEPTPKDYVDALVRVFREVRRVLADDGTLWVNVGDKYAVDPGGNSRGGVKDERYSRLRDRNALPSRLGPGRCKLPAKNLIGLPWRLALALQDDGWILRADIIWEKPNAMPCSVTDRPTVAHEYVFLFAKKPTYFYDADAVREPYKTPERAGRAVSASAFRGQRAQKPGGRVTAHDYNKGGANMRTVWRIPVGGADPAAAHIAPMPPALARRCILAGSARGDHVLGPFGGSGTTARVAEEEGRHATIIDLDARSIDVARELTAQVGLPA